MAARGTETVLASADGWEVGLSAANARKARAASTGKVVLGARHSTLKVHKAAVPGAVGGRVYTVEPTGDITFAHIYLGTSIVVVSLEPQVAIRPDEPVWVEFDQEKIHLFDGATQLALAAA